MFKFQPRQTSTPCRISPRCPANGGRRHGLRPMERRLLCYEPLSVATDVYRPGGRGALQPPSAGVPIGPFEPGLEPKRRCYLMVQVRWEFVTLRQVTPPETSQSACSAGHARSRQMAWSSCRIFGLVTPGTRQIGQQGQACSGEKFCILRLPWAAHSGIDTLSPASGVQTLRPPTPRPTHAKSRS